MSIWVTGIATFALILFQSSAMFGQQSTLGGGESRWPTVSDLLGQGFEFLSIERVGKSVAEDSYHAIMIKDERLNFCYIYVQKGDNNHSSCHEVDG